VPRAGGHSFVMTDDDLYDFSILDEKENPLFHRVVVGLYGLPRGVPPHDPVGSTPA